MTEPVRGQTRRPRKVLTPPEQDDRRVRRSATGPAPAAVPAGVAHTVASAGSPLDTATRAAMESRFGRDFGNVRVHTDAAAADSARSVNARAYTVGEHIAFDHGQYRPDTSTGRDLLTHELSHVAQQHPGVQRAPWGVWPDPSAKILDAREEEIWQAAEMRMVEYYRAGHSGNVVVSNQNRLETLSATKGDFGRLVRALQGEFSTHQELPFLTGPELTARADEVAAPQAVEGEDGPEVDRPETLRATRAAPGPKLKEPDILDLTTGEIYDVTTIGGADERARKIEVSYAGLLNDIVHENNLVAPAFRPGTSLARPAPEILRYNFQGTRVIYYGPTDLTTRGGVLAYAALEDPAAGAKEPGPPTEPYVFRFVETEITVQAGPPGSVTDLLPQNVAAANGLKGVIFHTLHRAKSASGRDTIDVRIDTADAGTGSKLPIEIKGDRNFRLIVHPKTRQVSFTQQKFNKPYHLRFLSEGRIERLAATPDGLRGAGTLTPSIPLLGKRPLEVAFGPDELRVVTALNQDRLRVPIPGFRVTQASIELLIAPEFRPSGTLAFALGPRTRPLADGALTIAVDGEGFVARGTLLARIPGLDEASAVVEYRPATGWTGDLTLTTSKIPYVDRAQVTVRLTDGGLAVAGGMTIGLPGGNSVDLTVARRGELWVFVGTAELTVPKLHPVRLRVVYDGKHLAASGETGINLQGFTGRLAVEYRDGVFSGEGTLSGRKGRATLEQATVRYNGRTGKLSGSGRLSYQVSENLIATAGVDIPEVGPIKVRGQLTFPKPIPLFRPFGGPVSIFTLPTLKIPIPGASIGGIGLKVTVRGGLDGEYGVGPGTLQDTRISADFQPFEEDKDLVVDLESRLVVPAFAKLTAYVSAGLEIDVLVAGAGGELTLDGSATLDGGVFIPFRAHYEKDRFTAEAVPEISAKLILALGLKAKVYAEAGVWRFKVRTTKEWKLAGFRYDTGLNFGMRAPIRYDSAANPAFTAPTLDSIQWIKPTLDPGAMLSRLMSGTGVETED